MPARKMFDFRVISDQAAAVIGKPVAFFRNMGRAGGFREPVAFVIVLSFVTAGLFVLAYTLGLEPLPPGVASNDGALVVAALIAIPLAILLSSLIVSALLFLLWRLMGSRQSFETAYRCFAYTYAITPVTTVLGILPYLGFVGVVWTALLLALASVEVHRISPRAAYPVFAALGLALAAVTLSAPHWLSMQRALLEQARSAPVAKAPAAGSSVPAPPQAVAPVPSPADAASSTKLPADVTPSSPSKPAPAGSKIP